jgi:hypothetical protein
VILMGRVKKSETLKRSEWLDRKTVKASASPKGKYVILRLKVRGVNWQRISRENFVGFCNLLNNKGKERLERDLSETYGYPIWYLEYDHIQIIKNPEIVIHQFCPIKLLKPLKIKKIEPKALLEYISKISQEKGTH